MPKTEKVTHVLFRCDDLHLHDGLLRFIRIEVLGGLDDKGGHIAKWKTRRSDTARNLTVKRHVFLHLLASQSSSAIPTISPSRLINVIQFPFHHHFQAPRVLFFSHPSHFCTIGLQPSDHDNGLGFASTFLEGCSGRNLEGNGGGVHWVESTILRVKARKMTSVKLNSIFRSLVTL